MPPHPVEKVSSGLLRVAEERGVPLPKTVRKTATYSAFDRELLEVPRLAWKLLAQLMDARGKDSMFFRDVISQMLPIVVG